MNTPKITRIVTIEVGEADIVPENEEAPLRIPQKRIYQLWGEDWVEINPHWREDITLYRWSHYFQKLHTSEGSPNE